MCVLGRTTPNQAFIFLGGERVKSDKIQVKKVTDKFEMISVERGDKATLTIEGL